MATASYADEVLIQGRVLDQNSKNPIELATIYIANTSFHTQSDANGYFKLAVPSDFLNEELVVSRTGFVSQKFVLQELEIGKSLVIVLETKTLDEVRVTAKRDKDWRKKYELFRKGLLGESKYAKNCTIEPFDAIRLTTDSTGKIYAYSDTPLTITNKGLGFTIIFEMLRFETDGNKTYFSGYKYFIDSLGRNDSKMEILRNKVYNDSFRNFLLSVSNNLLNENGFEIYKMKALKEIYLGRTTLREEIEKGALIHVSVADICSFDRETQNYFLYSEYPLLIFVKNRLSPTKLFIDAPFQFSQLFFLNDLVEFTKTGWLLKPNGILINGYWGNEGFSTMLPTNFLPKNLISSTEEFQKIIEK